MGRQRTSPSADLTALRKRIDARRQIKGGGEAMPQPLWQEAAALARLHGITPTARALKLHYSELKRRALAEPAPPSAEANAEPPRQHQHLAPFVDITHALFAPMPAAPTPTVLELTSGGQTLKLTFGESSAVDLAALVRAFVEAAP